MILPPLHAGRILSRYKRFFADVELDDGRTVTAHCPNTGSMKSCWAPGAPVEVSYNDNPKRKLRWTLERVDMGGGWIGVNTTRVNAIVREGIKEGRIPMLSGYTSIRSEPRVPAPLASGARFDLELKSPGRPVCLVEIKNATFLDEAVVQFPDAVTTRGLKHLELLLKAARVGYRSCLVFAINRPETTRFRPASHVDPQYAARLAEAAGNGVEIILAVLRHDETGVGVVGGRYWTETDDGCA